MNDKEFESVISLTGARRYTYFIKKVADFEEIWGLAEKRSWLLSDDSEGNLLLPVWPHKRYAEACIGKKWSESVPEKMSLDEFFDWVPDLKARNLKIAVFPSPKMKGVVVEIDKLLNDLEIELQLYE